MQAPQARVEGLTSDSRSVSGVKNVSVTEMDTASLLRTQ
jgi:hypothetical protein